MSTIRAHGSGVNGSSSATSRNPAGRPAGRNARRRCRALPPCFCAAQGIGCRCQAWAPSIIRRRLKSTPPPLLPPAPPTAMQVVNFFRSQAEAICWWKGERGPFPPAKVPRHRASLACRCTHVRSCRGPCNHGVERQTERHVCYCVADRIFLSSPGASPLHADVMCGFNGTPYRKRRIPASCAPALAPCRRHVRVPA